MAKNMNSKLAKLFLLGCANAAILTAVPQTVMAVNIEIIDLINRTNDYYNAPLNERLGIINNFKDPNGGYEVAIEEVKDRVDYELKQVNILQSLKMEDVLTSKPAFKALDTENQYAFFQVLEHNAEFNAATNEEKKGIQTKKAETYRKKDLAKNNRHAFIGKERMLLTPEQKAGYDQYYVQIANKEEAYNNLSTLEKKNKVQAFLNENAEKLMYKQVEELKNILMQLNTEIINERAAARRAGAGAVAPAVVAGDAPAAPIARRAAAPEVVRLMQAFAERRPTMPAPEEHVPGRLGRVPAVDGIAPLAPVSVVNTGRIEKRLTPEDQSQLLDILVNSKHKHTNTADNQKIFKEAIEENEIGKIISPIEKLKYVIISGVDGKNKLKTIADYANATLTKDEIKHTFFETNITAQGKRLENAEVIYAGVGKSVLLENIKAIDNDDAKSKLLKQFEKYVNENLVEIESNASNISARRTVMRFADPVKIVTYLETMAKLKETYFDNGRVFNVKEYNKVLKDAGLITNNLDRKAIEGLMNNFNAKNMDELALILKNTTENIGKLNKILVGIKVPPPLMPTSGVGGPGVLKNLDSLGDPELRAAGYSLKAKEDAAPPKPGRPARVPHAPSLAKDPSTDEGKVYNKMYIAKNPKNHVKVELRSISVLEDLGDVIKNIITVNLNKSPEDSLKLFLRANGVDNALKTEAQNVWNNLKNDELIQQIVAEKVQKKIEEGTFFDELFTEEEYNAVNRLNVARKKLSKDLVDHELPVHLKKYELSKDLGSHLDKLRIKDELGNISKIVSRIDYIKNNADYLDANSLDNEVERIVNNFADLNFDDKVDLAANQEQSNVIIAETARADEVNNHVKSWVNNNLIDLVIGSNIGNADLKVIQGKAEPAALSKLYEKAIDTKEGVLKQILVTHAANPNMASKTITAENISDDVLNDFNAGMVAIIPNTQNFSKDQVAGFLNDLNDTKIEYVLGEVKKVKNSKRVRPQPVPVAINIDAGIPLPPPPPPPLLGRAVGVEGFRGIGMDGVVDRLGTLKALEDRFPENPKKAPRTTASDVASSKIGQLYIDALEATLEAAKEKTASSVQIIRRNEGERTLTKLLTEKVFENHISSNPDLLNIQSFDEIGQTIERGMNMKVIEPKTGAVQSIDLLTRALYVELSTDIGFMQQFKADNPQSAELIASVAATFEEVAKEYKDLTPVETKILERALNKKAQAENQGNLEGFAELFGEESIPGAFDVPEEAPRVAPAAARVAARRVAARFGVVAEDAPAVEAPAEGGVEHEVAAVVDVPNAPEAPANVDGENAPEAPAQVNGENAPAAPKAFADAATVSAPASNEDRANSKFEDKKNSDFQEVANDSEEEVRLADIEEERAAEAARANALEVTTMQEAVKEDDKIIATIYNPVRDIYHINDSIISNRMRMISLGMAAVAAGDEDERVLDKGVWISGTVGTNKQGTQKGFAGYKGNTSGGTIGFDVGSDNYKDLVGIAYTKLDSKFKSSGNKLNTNIDSHIVALYGQKELPKNFMIQGMFAYNHNIVKSKINRLGTIASGKYKNDSYSFEGLLSYNYLTGNKVSITPNIGLRYGHIKDGTYQENGAGIQHLSIASKKQHIVTGIIGGSVALAPQKIIGGVSITPALQGSVENYFNRKSKKLDTKVKWKDREVNQNVALPKQPKVGYNIGASVLTEKDNVSVALEYNCHLQKKYQSHQGFVKLKVKL